jgi:hypothetical protein
MSDYLKPHTPEWFAALKKTNPKQAIQTETILSAAGSKDVCSICGDEDSSDYRLAGDQAVVGVVSTLRLCKDCLGIRRSMHHENFVPLAN